MDKKYYSKKDWWLRIVIWACIIALMVSLLDAIMNGHITAILLFTILEGFFIWTWFGTYYVLKEDHLFIRSGPVKEKFYYNNINKIKQTKSVLSSTALSVDRIEIIYKGSLGAYISPKDSEEFINKLKEKCPKLNISNIRI